MRTRDRSTRPSSHEEGLKRPHKHKDIRFARPKTSGYTRNNGLQDVYVYMGGCQNYGPLLGPLNTRCGIILRSQKGSIILTSFHMVFWGPIVPHRPRFRSKSVASELQAGCLPNASGLLLRSLI